MSILKTPPKNGLIGHRGLAGLAPENTLISFQAAKDYGFDWLEFDVQLSKDHELIIFHDQVLNRTTNGKGRVYEHNLSQLQLLDAGSWFHQDFAGTPIPNLNQNLKDIISLNTKLNIEIKCPSNTSQLYKQELINSLIDFLNGAWPKHFPLPLLSSFDWDILLKIREKVPSVPIGFLCEQLTSEVIRIAAQTSNVTVNCLNRGVDVSKLKQLLLLEIPVLVFTVNDKDEANSLLDQGVFAVFTDRLTEDSQSIRRVG